MGLAVQGHPCRSVGRFLTGGWPDAALWERVYGGEHGGEDADERLGRPPLPRPPPAPGLCSARPWQGRVRLASVDSTTMLTSRTSSLPPGSQSLHALPTGLLQPPRVFSLRRLRKQATSLAHTAPSGRAGTETQKAAVQGHGLTAPPHR